MPDDKKNNQKSKHDPKEQRRPRQRHQAGPVEKKNEKKIVDPKPSQERKVSVTKTPTYEDPGPEFYKNLKRETDEILKITEEANTKYKKKEIQSNWTKYEMPIESYEEIEEQENLGADFEKLIQAPLSIGGHFQFKHEKSWDISTGPSLYDKYFDINMDRLSLALSTIPFYERNSLDLALFDDTDILTMNNRSTKFKQKYYNDKSYSTPETEAQEKILKSLKSDNVHNEEFSKDTEEEESPEENRRNSECIDIKLEPDIVPKSEPIITPNFPIIKDEVKVIKPIEMETKAPISKMFATFDDILDNVEQKTSVIEMKVETKKVRPDIIKNEIEETLKVNKKSELASCKNEKAKDELLTNQAIQPATMKTELKNVDSNVVPANVITEPANKTNTNIATPENETKKNPVIESPEDLEKWLDDFLDG